MKKVLIFITALLGLFMLIFSVLMHLNGVLNFMALPTSGVWYNIIEYVTIYGPLVIMALWVLFYFAGKGALRIILAILIVLIIAVGVIAIGFPNLISNLFGV